MDSVKLQDFLDAQKRLVGVTEVTPLRGSASLSKLYGMPLFFKCENLQKTGSFKIRGSYNRIAQLSEEERARGVITASSGNSGSGTAYAAMLLGIRAVIVMPEKFSPAKRAACEAFGAEVHFVGQTTAERLAWANDMSEREGLIMVHPYDDPRVIAGQGTIGLELLDQCSDVEQVIIQIGGGGLISGIASALRLSGFKGRIVGVEPEVSPRMAYAWQQGAPEQLKEWSSSIADGINSVSAGQYTYPLAHKYVDELVTVSEDDIRAATRLMLERTKLWIEPSGAAAFAAVYAGKIQKGLKTACIISGGNIDVATLMKVLA